MHNRENIVALLGAPNAGKTTLYNWLTNSQFKTVNYPGATVEYSVGHLAGRYGGHPFLVMDTPGTYSLFPKSDDEAVTVKAIFNHPQYGYAKVVIVVVDATQLSRHLLLVDQAIRSGFQVVVALTMSDIVQQNGLILDIAQLEKQFGVPFIPVDGLLGGGVVELITATRKYLALDNSSLPKVLNKWTNSELENQLKKYAQISDQVIHSPANEKSIDRVLQKTLDIDQVLLHPIFGLFIFAGIMTLVFSSIFWFSAPLMDLIDGGFSALAVVVTTSLGENLFSDFIANGVIASFSGVLIFVPQIFILFAGIGLLESSGYLARAATMIDRPFSKIGLSGRSFVPILSGFACAVPALMATRNIPSKRERWLTAFIVPLMTCSARLPVYALLLSFLFRGHPVWQSGLAMTALYLFAILTGAVVSGVVNKILKKNEISFFMMELPLYRRPQLRVIFRQSLTRTLSYVKRAGPMIFVFSALIWAGTTFPNYSESDSQIKLEQSYLGQAGKVIQPVFEPMGVDWRVGIGLLSAFAAREVFVSTMAVIFHITDEDEDSQQQQLLTAMDQAKMPDGQPVFTFASVIGLLVFFSIALQCISTFGVAVREMGSYTFALTQLVVFNLLAYGLAVLIVNAIRTFGIS